LHNKIQYGSVYCKACILTISAKIVVVIVIVVVVDFLTQSRRGAEEKSHPPITQIPATLFELRREIGADYYSGRLIFLA
jgi:hypothetical protein